MGFILFHGRSNHLLRPWRYSSWEKIFSRSIEPIPAFGTDIFLFIFNAISLPDNAVSKRTKSGTQQPCLAPKDYFFLPPQINDSNPLRSSRLRSLRDGPLGCLPSISHCRMVERLVFRTEANAAWLNWKCLRKERIFLIIGDRPEWH